MSFSLYQPVPDDEPDRPEFLSLQVTSRRFAFVGMLLSVPLAAVNRGIALGVFVACLYWFKRTSG